MVALSRFIYALSDLACLKKKKKFKKTFKDDYAEKRASSPCVEFKTDVSSVPSSWHYSKCEPVQIRSMIRIINEEYPCTCLLLLLVISGSIERPLPVKVGNSWPCLVMESARLSNDRNTHAAYTCSKCPKVFLSFPLIYHNRSSSDEARSLPCDDALRSLALALIFTGSSFPRHTRLDLELRNSFGRFSKGWAECRSDRAFSFFGTLFNGPSRFIRVTCTF